MKKDKKNSPRRRIVELGPEALSDKKSVDAAKFGKKKSVSITRSTVIRAPIEKCFELVSKQLEENQHWDPIIMWVNPISTKYVRIGSMSRVTFNFREVIEEAVAMIRSFQSNRTILWTSTHSCQLQEEWHFKSEPHGTVVTVTLSYNPVGWAIARLIEKTVMKNRVEKDVSEMLERLKAAVENQSPIL